MLPGNVLVFVWGCVALEELLGRESRRLAPLTRYELPGIYVVAILVGHFGWSFWLVVLVGRFGCPFRLVVMVGRFGWLFWLAILVRCFDWPVWLAVLVGLDLLRGFMELLPHPVEEQVRERLNYAVRRHSRCLRLHRVVGVA